MEKAPLISIIIPVYNAEKYLSQCVESILEQTYENIEIILVNDDSTDNSGFLCNDFKQVSDKIQVIHKKNEGAALTRNRGLLEAKGEWIIFQDADDFWDDKNGLEELMKYYNSIDYEVDLVFFNYKRYFQSSNIYMERPDFPNILVTSVDKNIKLKQIFLNSFIPAPPWGKLIKKKLLTNNNILFPNQRSSEDIPWFIQLIQKSTNFSFVNIRFHVYRKQVESSLTYEFNKKKYDTLFDIVYEESEKWKEIKNNNIHEYIMSFLAYQYLILLSMSVNFKLKTFLAEQKRLKKMKWLLKYDKIKKVNQIQKMSRFLPQWTISYALYYYAKQVVNKK